MNRTEEYHLHLARQDTVDIDERNPNYDRYDPAMIGTERFKYVIYRRDEYAREAREELQGLYKRLKQVCKQNLPKTFTFEDGQEDTYIYDPESDGYGNIIMVITETEDRISERDEKYGHVSRKLPLSIRIGFFSNLRFELARNPWRNKAVVETIVKENLPDVTFTWQEPYRPPTPEELEQMERERQEEMRKRKIKRLEASLSHTDRAIIKRRSEGESLWGIASGMGVSMNKVRWVLQKATQIPRIRYSIPERYRPLSRQRRRDLERAK